MKPTYRNVLDALAGINDYVPSHHLPDGNGRSGCAREEVLSAMRREGLIEYGKKATNANYGWRITDAGRAALASSAN